MRFEVTYPNGESHEVELPGTLAVLGRDPGSDLVLNDVKCSRRHAVVEAGADGVVIRDTESANGIFVNGRKVERARLKEGDLVRVGEIMLRVLPDEATGTVVMGPEDMADLGLEPPPPGSRPGRGLGSLETEPLDPAEAPVRSPGRRPVSVAPPVNTVAASPRKDAAPAASARPLTVTVLALLWAAAAVLYAGGAAWSGLRAGLPPHYRAAAIALGAGLAVLSVVMAVGLWRRRPWARVFQIAIASIGLVFCPMTLASATVLVYCLRRGARVRFADRAPAQLTPEEAAAGADLSAETAFTMALLAMTALGVLLAGVLAFLARPPGA